MERVSELQIREAVANFNFVGRLKSRRPFGSGHINDTYLLVFEIGDMGDVNVILQRMNREIFTKPVELMENIVGVTSYLREKIIENGGDPERETLNMIPAKDGKAYYVDSKGEYWRAYKSSLMRQVTIRLRSRRTSMKALLLSGISRDSLPITRRRRSTRRSKDSTIQKQDFRYLKKLLQKTCAVVPRQYKRRSTLSCPMRMWQMYSEIFWKKARYLCASPTMIQSSTIS